MEEEKVRGGPPGTDRCSDREQQQQEQMKMLPVLEQRGQVQSCWNKVLLMEDRSLGPGPSLDVLIWSSGPPDLQTSSPPDQQMDRWRILV